MRNFVLFLIILFIIASLLRIDFFFTIVYLFAAVYVLSHMWTQRVGKKLRAGRRFVDHAFLGDRPTVELRVENTGWLPVPWLHVHESLPVRLTPLAAYRRILSLGPRETRRLEYTLYCNRRGYYPVGPLNLRMGDLLGITRTVQVQVAPQYIVVYPRVVPLQALGLPTRSPQALLPARAPLFQDPTRVMGVRDYQRGDSPRRIHWTATASAGRLLVKRYQPAIARETLICLDLDGENYGRRQQYTATELAIVAAASLANHIIVQEGLPVGLTTEALDPLSDERTRFYLPPRSERAHLVSLLEVLARVQITSQASLTALLRRASMDLPWGATISVITGRESAELFDSLLYLRRAGFAVALTLVQPARPSAEMRERTGLLQVPIHRVWAEDDLERLL
jgi:uncharacterized protein (DUF58 family)